MDLLVKVQQLDVPNKNGRVYSTETMTKAIEEFKQRERPLFGCVRLSTLPQEVENISHEIKDLRIEGDYLVAELHVLETPKGDILRTMCIPNPDLGYLEDPAFNVGFRPAGKGDVRILEDGTVEVYNYTLLSIDLVSNPA